MLNRLNAKNIARATLSADLSADSSKLYVRGIEVFPEPPFLITVDDEIMLVLSKNINNLSLDVIRGYEGTIPTVHYRGVSVENRFTAGTLDTVFNELEKVKSKTLSTLRKVLFLYSYPSAVNGLWDNEAVGTVLSKYDDVIFPSGVTKSDHYDHDRLPIMIQTAKSHNTEFKAYGYITLMDFLDIEKGEEHVLNTLLTWKQMGVDGIFWDEFGFDYFEVNGVFDHYDARTIQNKAMTMAHGNGLMCIVNAWNIDDVFGTDDGLIPEIEWWVDTDGYLYESIPFHASSDTTTIWASADDIWYKAHQINSAYKKYKVRTMGVATVGSDVANDPRLLDQYYNIALGVAYSIGLDGIGIEKRHYYSNDPVLLPIIQDKISFYGHKHSNTYSYYTDQTFVSKKGNTYVGCTKYIQTWPGGVTTAIYANDERTPYMYRFEPYFEWDVDVGFIDYKIAPVLNNVKLDGNDVVVSTNFTERMRIKENGQIQLSTQDIQGLVIRNDMIEDGAVDTDKLADNAVTKDKILAGTITGDRLVNKTITDTQLADGAVTNIKLASNAVTNDKIAANTIKGDRLENGAITDTQLAENAVKEAKINNGAVTTTKIADSAVTNNKLANSAVSSGKLLHHTSKGMDLLINGDFTDANGDSTLDGWTSISGTATLVNVGVNGTTGRYAMQNSGTNVFYRTTNLIPIDRNKQYSIECYARTISGSTGTFSLAINLLDANGNIIAGDGTTYWYYAANGVTPGTSWTPYSGIFGSGTSKTFPANAVHMQVIVSPIGTSGDRVIQVQGIKLREVLDASKYIVDKSVDTNKIADSAVNNDKLANGAVTYQKIAQKTIKDENIADNTITGGKLVNGTITDTQLAAGAVTNAKLGTKAVKETNIDDLAVTNAKLASNAVKETNIEDGAVSTNKLAAGAVTNAKLASNAVKETNIEDSAVTTNKLASGAVTNAKLGNSAVKEANIDDLAVTNTKLGTGAVSTVKIADKAVSSGKLLHHGASGINLVINGNFTDIDGNPTIDGWEKAYSSGGNAIVTDLGTDIGFTSRYALQNENIDNRNVRYVTKTPIPIDRNKSYLFECYARTANGTTGTMRLIVCLLDRDKNVISGDGTYWYYPGGQFEPGTSWTRYSGVFGAGTSKTFPNNAVYLQVGVILNEGSSANRIMQVQGVRLVEIINPSYLGLSSSPVGTSDTQTLTNKTLGTGTKLDADLDANYKAINNCTTITTIQSDISTIQTNVSGIQTDLSNHKTTKSGTHGVTGDIVGTTDTQTLTNKSFGTGNLLIADFNASNKKIVNLATPTDNTDAARKQEVDAVQGSLTTHMAAKTVHGISGEVVGTTDTQTLTNKTLGEGTKLGADLDANNKAITNCTTISTIQSDISTIQTNVSTIQADLSSHKTTKTGIHGVSGDVVGTSDTQTLTNKTLGSGTKLSANLDANNFAIVNSPDIIRLNQRPMENFNSATIPYMVFSRFLGNLSGAGKWYGGVLAPNGKIYAIPFHATQVLEIDPISGTTTLIGSTYSGTYKWGGGVLAPNGKIYAIPCNATQVLEIDPISGTTTLIGSTYSDTYKWAGGVLAPNGKIYAIPFNATQVLEIDPISDTTTLIGSTYSGTAKWIGGVLAPNGKIYAIPHSATQVLEIDPISGTTTLIGSTYSGTYKWYGGVLAPNGKIYAIPCYATQVLEIDPISGTTTLIGSTYSGTYKWYGGVLAPNGKIYAIPHDATQVLEIDPISGTTTLIGSTYSGTAKWIGGVLAPNGKIYAIPSSATQVLEITIMNYLSPHLNKY